MIKLNLTLGNTSMSHFYGMMYSDEYGPVLPKIRQHRIVLSERLVSYYEECASANGLKESCTTYLQALIKSNDRCVLINVFDETQSIEEEMIGIALLQPMKILIAEQEEISKKKKGLNLLRSNDINNNQNCILNLYCIPVPSRYVEGKKPVEAYTKWLSNWFQGEKNIIIRDKHMLCDHGIESFKKFFLPMFEKGASIIIQTDSKVNQKYIDEFDKEDYKDYQINIYKCSAMHDRVIIAGDFQVVIGKGIDFLSADWNMTSESFISISRITMDARSTEKEQIR